MGGSFSQERPENKVLMIGLNDSGKTTILNTLKLGRFVTPMDTPYKNTEKFVYRGVTFAVREIDDVQDHWSKHIADTKGVILVLDSSEDDVKFAKVELLKILSENRIRKAGILIFANKKDLPNAMTKSEVTKELGLNSFTRDIKQRVFVQSTHGFNDYSMIDGLNWLAKHMKKMS